MLLSEQFNVKRPVLADVGIILGLLQFVDLAEVGYIRSSEAEVRDFWEFPNHDPARDAWLIMDAGRLVAFNFLGHLPPISRLFSGPCVHPDYAGQGLHAYLIELSLERARELIPEAAEDLRISLSIWCRQKNQELKQELVKAHFAHVRSNWLMEIKMLQAPPEPVWPDGLELRPYRPELLRAVFEADDEAFQDHWGHTTPDFEMWQHWTVKREGFDPTLWFLLFDGPEIAGYALCLYEHGEPWVGELGVRRPWRRRGLGLAFLQQAFGEFYRRGERRVVLNVDSQNLMGATRLYTRAGMSAFEQTDIYERELRAGIELSTQTLSVGK